MSLLSVPPLPLGGAVHPRLRPCLYGIVGFNLTLLVVLLTRPGPDRLISGLDNVLQFVGPLLALGLCQGAHIRVSFQRRAGLKAHAWAAIFLGLGVACFAVGQMIWAWYELVLGRALPMPSWADVSFLSAYPCLLLGIALLPGRRLSRAFRVRSTLDGLLIMSAIATLSWYFILGPMITASAGSRLEKVVGLAYPLGDLVLIGCLLRLTTRVDDARHASAATLLVLGLATIVITDTSFILHTLAGTYATGNLLDPGWPLGYMLVALGASAFRTVPEGTGLGAVPQASDAHGNPPGDGSASDGPHVWQALLPYALVPAVGGLLLYVLRTSADEALAVGVYVGSGSVLALVVLRQVCAIFENAQLYRTIERSYRALEMQHQALAAANRRLEDLATIDPLTDVPNHRAMVTALDTELERAQRWNQSFAVLFFDLDHFKALNDGYGHGQGDAALREFGQVVRTTLRAVDSFGRWGGEEFVAVLPQTDGASALTAAERVRKAVNVHTFTPLQVHLTCSIGVAVYPDDGRERNTLVAGADRAMYAAKQLGRNQVRTAGDPALTILTAGLPTSRADTALACTVDALAELVALRDAYTGQHTQEVGELTTQLAQALGCDPVEELHIAMAGRLHDIGKVALPDAVLQKPGRLTADEWTLIQTHPVVGADVVSRVPSLRTLVPTIRSHHERWDGTGYPDGLAGTAIPLGARIVAVADAYAAMTTDRPYRQARSMAAALLELEHCAGTQFDPAAVAALRRLLTPHESHDTLSERHTTN